MYGIKLWHCHVIHTFYVDCFQLQANHTFELTTEHFANIVEKINSSKFYISVQSLSGSVGYLVL